MPEGMLGNNRLLNQVGGPVMDLLQSLNGRDGQIVFAEFTRFCRREPCWGDIIVPDGVPEGRYGNWAVDRHVPNGPLKVTWDDPFELARRKLFLDGREIALHVPTVQQLSLAPIIADVERLLTMTGFEMLNANVFNLLRRRKEIIPQSWVADEAGVPRRIHCLGTIFKQSPGEGLTTEHLYYARNEWHASDCWFNAPWVVGDCVAVLKRK